MSRARWLAWLPLHFAWSAGALLWWSLTRRGRGVLAFTHFQDLDATGRDHQMGPLVDALGARPESLMEVTLIPPGRALLRNWRWKRRAVVSWAAVLGAARILSWASGGADALGHARTRLAGLLLRALRPRVIYLVDESGSGQPLVRAARSLGIPTVAVQHGDFQPDNHQYRPRPGSPFDVVPVDRLCVWSPWFRSRLLACSPIYRAANVRVTGRLRYPPASPEPATAAAGAIRVLVLAEGRPELEDALRPWIRALEAEEGVELRVRPHPGAPGAGGPSGRGLGDELAACDLALGLASSGLIEALFHLRPVVVVAAPLGSPISVLVEAEITTPVDGPASLGKELRRLSGAEGEAQARRGRALLWEPATPDPVQKILNIGDALAAIHSPRTG